MKYDEFNTYLLRQTASEIPMTFAEIEALIGQPLPASARRHRPWWSNSPSNNVMTRIWLDAGYRTARVDMGSERLVFERTGPGPAKTTGPTTTDVLSQSYGALKGTVRFVPGIDLAAPTGEVWAADL